MRRQNVDAGWVILDELLKPAFARRNRQEHRPIHELAKPGCRTANANVDEVGERVLFSAGRSPSTLAQAHPACADIGAVAEAAIKRREDVAARLRA